MITDHSVEPAGYAEVRQWIRRFTEPTTGDETPEQKPLDAEEDGDTYTLLSPDVTVAVTDDTDYIDLRDWAVSLYRHAAQRCRGIGYDPRVLGALVFAAWLVSPDKRGEWGWSPPWDDVARTPPGSADMFGAAFLRLNPFFLIAEIATWLETECDADGIAVMEELTGAYARWSTNVLNVAAGRSDGGA